MIVTDFMYKGGFENFEIKDLNASDDTIMMLYTGNAIIKKKVTFNNYRESYIESFKYMSNEAKRGTGIRTLDSLKNLIKFNDPKIIFKFQSNGWW